MRSGNTRRSASAGQRNRGFVYIGLLIGLTVLGIGLGATSEVWTLSRQREKEVELLFIGDQFRFAINSFYQNSPAAAKRFPLTVEELLEDNRNPDKPARHLRRLYTDPMTQSTRWGEIRLAGGQLVGVYSESGDAPLKVADFTLRNKDLADKQHYFEWAFRSALPAANPTLAAGAGFNAGTGQPAARPGAGGNAAPGAGTGLGIGGGLGLGGTGGAPRQPAPGTSPMGFIQPTPRPRR